MPCLEGHSDLVQEDLEDTLLLRTVESSLVDFVVHHLYCYPLVGNQVDTQLHSE